VVRRFEDEAPEAALCHNEPAAGTKTPVTFEETGVNAVEMFVEAGGAAGVAVVRFDFRAAIAAEVAVGWI
jgi:hypothetical protein